MFVAISERPIEWASDVPTLARVVFRRVLYVGYTNDHMVVDAIDSYLFTANTAQQLNF